MVFRRRRIKRQTLGKDPIKHSATAIGNIGQGTNVGKFQIVTVPTRDTAGNVQTIQSESNTSTICQVSDIVKYVNICVGVANRNQTPDPVGVDDQGWLEYALIHTKEAAQEVVPSTNLGTKTLGDICTKMFRGDCLFTGCVPIGTIQAITLDLKFKIPAARAKLKLGSDLSFLTFFRAVESTDVRTDNIRLVQSCIYKCYS